MYVCTARTIWHEAKFNSRRRLHQKTKTKTKSYLVAYNSRHYSRLQMSLGIRPQGNELVYNKSHTEKKNVLSGNKMKTTKKSRGKKRRGRKNTSTGKLQFLTPLQHKKTKKTIKTIKTKMRQKQPSKSAHGSGATLANNFGAEKRKIYIFCDYCRNDDACSLPVAAKGRHNINDC